MKLPHNWPIHFKYSSKAIPIDIPENLLRNLLSSTDPSSLTKTASCIEEQKTHPHLQIERIVHTLQYRGPIPHPLSDSEIFEGHGQHGVFGRDRIEKETELGEYVGEIFFGSANFESALRFRGVHCWQATLGEITLNISSANIGNELAFINDYRGLAEAPNVRPKWILHRGSYYFGYETTREIFPMEELLVDYGETWAKRRTAIIF